jgi:hypothetical protein
MTRTARQAAEPVPAFEHFCDRSSPVDDLNLDDAAFEHDAEEARQLLFGQLDGENERPGQD